MLKIELELVNVKKSKLYFLKLLIVKVTSWYLHLKQVYLWVVAVIFGNKSLSLQSFQMSLKYNTIDTKYMRREVFQLDLLLKIIIIILLKVHTIVIYHFVLAINIIWHDIIVTSFIKKKKVRIENIKKKN